jgi:hypothetical protein
VAFPEAPDRHESPATFTEPELIGDYRTFEQPEEPASRRFSEHGRGGAAGEDRARLARFGRARVIRWRWAGRG